MVVGIGYTAVKSAHHRQRRCESQQPIANIEKATWRAEFKASEKASVGDFEIERIDRRAEHRIAFLQRRDPLGADHFVGEALRWRGGRLRIATELDAVDTGKPFTQRRSNLRTRTRDRVRVDVVCFVELD